MKDRENQRKYQREWVKRRYRTDPEFATAQKILSNQRYYKTRRAADLQRKYGLTMDDYNAMLTAQENKCAVCGSYSYRKRTLDVDHNHETGKVRGLLCSHCNRVVIAGVERIGLERITKYLQEGI
jgi:hypothetical protein